MKNSDLIVQCLHLYKQNVVVCDIESFKEDFQRFSYVIKQLSRYQTSGELNARLLLNHIVILQNVFGPYFVGVLFEKCPERLIQEMYSLLKFMNLIPKNLMITLPGGDEYSLVGIKIHEKLMSELALELERT